LVCGKCRHEFALPLTKRYGHKLSHVQPLDFHPVNNNVYWHLHSLGIPCPKCRENTQFLLPETPFKVVLPLYGDEACRQKEARCVYVLAFVGSDPRLEHAVRQEWDAMKTNIAPAQPPASWRLHMKELWKTSGGRRHPVFDSLTREQRVAATKKIADCYHSLNDRVFSFIAVYRAPKLSRATKQQALLSALAYMLERLCPRGTAPKITLESDQFAAGRPGMSYGTAHALEEFQRSLLYAILGRGLPVEDIAVARATESFWFELADYVAYVVARACLRRWQGTAPDLDPNTLGKAFWIGNQPGGNLFCDRCEGVPWEKFGGWPTTP
jgi:hypothetical protein